MEMWMRCRIVGPRLPVALLGAGSSSPSSWCSCSVIAHYLAEHSQIQRRLRGRSQNSALHTYQRNRSPWNTLTTATHQLAQADVGELTCRYTKTGRGKRDNNSTCRDARSRPGPAVRTDLVLPDPPGGGMPVVTRSPQLTGR